GLTCERQIGAAARREIVEHADARAVRKESLDEVGADEPCAARHEKHVRHVAIVAFDRRPPFADHGSVFFAALPRSWWIAALPRLAIYGCRCYRLRALPAG